MSDQQLCSIDRRAELSIDVLPHCVFVKVNDFRKLDFWAYDTGAGAAREKMKVRTCTLKSC